jgi:methionyl-tRNA formyltransferase
MPNKLNVIFAGSDIFSLCLESMLTRSDVNVRAIFSSDKPGHARTNALARTSNTRLFTATLNEQNYALLSNCDALISAGYSSKIPDFNIRFPVNLHPTALPMGRGGRPIPWVLFDQPEAAGVTLHARTQNFDAGPIISSQSFSGAEYLSFEAYAMICGQIGAELISSFLDDPETQFKAAQLQDISEWPLLAPFPDDRRFITNSMTGAEIVSKVKKLGPVCALLNIGGSIVQFSGAEFLPDAGKRPHKMFENNSLFSAFRCRDGFIIIRPYEIHSNS